MAKKTASADRAPVEPVVTAAPIDTCDFDDNPALPGRKMCAKCDAEFRAIQGWPENRGAPATPGAEFK